MSSVAQEIDDTSSYSILHTFSAQTCGGCLSAGLTAVNGTLYGTTVTGGTNGYGTIFSITPAGKLTTLYDFLGTGDGAYPEAALTNVNGVLYGTASSGGNGYGNVYSITTAGVFSVRYDFEGGSDGANPKSALTYSNGTLYGTTLNGGSGTACTNGCGTVFALASGNLNDSVLHSFRGGADGSFPQAAVTDVDGVLYGTTAGGGSSSNCQSYGCGTVFRVTQAGKEAVLYSFQGGTNDGEAPAGPLIDVNGSLYGTTVGGGHSGCDQPCGTVYSVTLSGSEKIQHFFDGNDGSAPYDGFTAVNGNLFATTSGSPFYCGSIFKLSTSGGFSVVHRFGQHGCEPQAGLTLVNGALYATTTGDIQNERHNAGAIFKFVP